MENNPRLALRDIAFCFKYAKPRLLAGLMTVLLLAWPWFVIHPESFDKRPYYGPGASIDALIRASPNPVRIIICLGLEGYLFYLLFSFPIPCIRDENLIVFDGRELCGFGAWGREEALLLSEVDSVTYRGGSALVRGGGKSLWLPLSFLEMDEAHRKVVRLLLNEASS